jgi:hypothetical protein
MPLLPAPGFATSIFPIPGSGRAIGAMLISPSSIDCFVSARELESLLSVSEKVELALRAAEEEGDCAHGRDIVSEELLSAMP